MDWIERVFGFSPDNGDGSTETFLLMVGVSVAIGIVTWRNKKARAGLRAFLSRYFSRGGHA